MTIPESSQVRCSSLFRNCQRREFRNVIGCRRFGRTRDAELDHCCFVPDDGCGWTLNGPLPRSNGWRTSPPFPTPGHSARATSQRPTAGTTKRCLTVRGFASGSLTVYVADLQIQASPYQNPAASLREWRRPEPNQLFGRCKPISITKFAE